MSKRHLLIFASLLVLEGHAVYAQSETEQVARALREASIPSSQRPLSLAQSLNTGRSTAARIEQANDQIANEVQQVIQAFTGASPEDRVAKTLAKVRQFSPETAAAGAARSFEGSRPGISALRQIAFVKIPLGTQVAAAQGIMDIVTSFERSPKDKDDYFYEYSDSSHLASSQISEMRGSASSWKLNPRASIEIGQDRVDKKCRWVSILFSGDYYCMTILGRVLPPANTPGQSSQVYASFLIDFSATRDHAMFTSDSRGQNTANGSTSVYVVKQIDNLALIYNVGLQHKDEDNSFELIHDRMNAGHKAEYQLFLTRLQYAFATKKLDWQVLRISN